MTQKQYDFLDNLNTGNFDEFSKTTSIDYRLVNEVKKLPVDFASKLISYYLLWQDYYKLNNYRVRCVALNDLSGIYSADEGLEKYLESIKKQRKEIAKELKNYPNVSHEEYCRRYDLERTK